MKTFIGNKTFNSKKEAKQFIREYITNGKIEEKDIEDWIKPLFDLHPDYAMKGEFEKIYIGMERGTKCFRVKYKDGRDWSFSYVKCLEPKGNYFYVSRAMRDLIETSVMRFRHSNSLNRKCDNCGKTDCKLEVDHSQSAFTFYQLKTDFWKLNNIDPDTVGVLTDKGNYRFQDDRLNKKWVKFHDTNAIFRWLCSDCNKVLW